MSATLFFPPPAKCVAGLLASNREILAETKSVLATQFGPIDLEGETVPFEASNYYCAEMGNEIWRQFVSFEKRVESETLADLKSATNRLEGKWAQAGRRRANVDPGLLSLEKLVVASTKPASYRVYLRDGIYAQPMLLYEKGAFRPLPWTYADYQWPATLKFFNDVRNLYIEQQKELKVQHG